MSAITPLLISLPSAKGVIHKHCMDRLLRCLRVSVLLLINYAECSSIIPGK